jgi:hypothetical protein
MPYQSPAGAALSGIEAGWGMVRQAQQQQRDNDRQDRLDRLNQAHMEFMERNETDKNNRENWKQAWEAHTAQQKDLGDQLNDLLGEYHGDRDAAANDPRFKGINAQRMQWNDVHNSLMKAAYSETLEKGNDAAQATTDKMNAGTFDPTHPANAEELAHWVSTMYRHDPTTVLPQSADPATNQFGDNSSGLQNAAKGQSNTLMGVDPLLTGQSIAQAPAPKSQFTQGVQDVHQGLTNGDQQQVGNGFQSLYGPQIEAGRLGYMDPAGGIIMSATLNANRPFVPTPDGKGVMPVLTTTGVMSDGTVTTQPYAAPTQGGYHHDDNQELHSLDVGKTLDYMGAQGAAHSILQHPAVQDNLRDYMQNPSQQVQDFAAAYTALGAGNGLVAKVENRGGKLMTVSYTKDGRQVDAKEVPGSFAPTNEYEGAYHAWEGIVARDPSKQVDFDKWVMQRENNKTVPKGIGADEKIASIRALEGQPHLDGSPGVYSREEINGIIGGVVPKASTINPVALAKLTGADAEEGSRLNGGYIKDQNAPSGWKKAKSASDLDELQSARDAFNHKHGAHEAGVSKPGVVPAPGTQDPQNAVPQSKPVPPPTTPEGKLDITKMDENSIYVNPKGVRAKWDPKQGKLVVLPAGQ